MKIAVMTFFNYNNFGASLQCYGLYKTLKDMGHEVEYLDYTCPYIGNPFKLIHLKNKGLFGYIYSTMGYICYLPRKKYFDEFRKLIPHTKPLNESNISEYKDTYDKYIAGSDQVWSTKLTNYDKTYFLDFVTNNKKKFSYAASFGGNTVDDLQYKWYEMLLKEFQKISVREEYGEKLVERLAQRDAKVVVDPTLLLSENDWAEVCAERIVKGNYILVYQLGFSKQLIQTVKKVAGLTGMKVVYIPFPLGGIVKSRLSIGIGPSEWLSLFRYAKYVITDSYHGIIFSILFRKKFLGVVDGQHKNQRAISLLNKLGLQDRIAGDNEKKILEEINYEQVLLILKREIADSKQWLRENI